MLNSDWGSLSAFNALLWCLVSHSGLSASADIAACTWPVAA